MKERRQGESHPPQSHRIFSAWMPQISSAAVPPLPRRGLVFATRSGYLCTTDVLRAFRAPRFCCISSITDSIPQNFDSAPLIICTHHQKPQRGSAQDDTRGISRPQIRTRKCNWGRVRVTLPMPAARQCYMVPSPVTRAPTTRSSLN